MGDVPVSGTLNQTAALLAAVVLLPVATAAVWTGFVEGIGTALSGEAPRVWSVTGQLLSATVPLLICAAAASLAPGAVQTGGLFTPAKLSPRLDALNPATGIKKLFSSERVVQVARALLTALLLGGLCLWLLRAHVGALVATLGRTEAGLGLAAALVMRLLWLAIGLSVAMAGIDVLLTRRAWLRRNRMSKDEVKREYRESEGDPQLKQERRRAHQEMLDNSSLLALREASVVIVNPTHLATALRYDSERDEAPTVVASGQGAFARQLVDAARAYGIPVVRDVPIAHALKGLGAGDEIPEELYEAVAEILREVWEQSGEARADED